MLATIMLVESHSLCSMGDVDIDCEHEHDRCSELSSRLCHAANPLTVCVVLEAEEAVVGDHHGVVGGAAHVDDAALVVDVCDWFYVEWEPVFTAAFVLGRLLLEAATQRALVDHGRLNYA